MKILEDEISSLNNTKEIQINALNDIQEKENESLQQLSTLSQFKISDEMKYLTNCILELRTNHRIEREIIESKQNKLIEYLKSVRKQLLEVICSNNKLENINEIEKCKLCGKIISLKGIKSPS